MIEESKMTNIENMDSVSISAYTDDFSDVELDNTVDILGNVNIKAATIDRLIDNLMNNNVTFIKEFLDTFPLFMKSEDFLELLIEEFNKNQTIETIQRSPAHSNMGSQTVGRGEGSKILQYSTTVSNRILTYRRHHTESYQLPLREDESKELAQSADFMVDKVAQVAESAPNDTKSSIFQSFTPTDNNKNSNMPEIESSMKRKGTEISLNYSIKSMNLSSATADYSGLTASYYPAATNTTRTISLKIMRTWLISHFMDFENSPALMNRIVSFISQIEGQLTKKDPLWRQVNVVSVTLNELRRGNPTNQQMKESDQDDLLSWDFMKHLDVAYALTIIDNDKHKKLKSRELINGAWTSDNKNETAPNVIELINHFNKLSRVVQTQIVKSQSKSTRVSEIETWISVAADLVDIKNYSALISIMAALDSSPVQRLKKTWAKVSAKKKKIHEDLKITFSPAGNYRNLRGIIDKLSEPTLPFLGCYLTQLTFIYDGAATFVKDDWINFSKCRRASNTMSAIRKSQNYSCNFEVNIKKVNFLRQVLSIPGLSDDEIYKLSLKSEPRD